MTQSKKSDEISLEDNIILDLSKQISDEIDDSIIINLNETYGATTSYHYDTNIGSITISGAASTAYTVGGIDTITSWSFEDKRIDPDEITRMSKEYPALEKVWDKFKSLYDMCKQDYEGKKKAGEL